MFHMDDRKDIKFIEKFQFSEETVTKVTDKNHLKLNAEIKKISEKAGLPNLEVYIYDKKGVQAEGKFVKNNRVYLSQELIEQHTPEEIGFIVGHEIGHKDHNSKFSEHPFFFGSMNIAGISSALTVLAGGVALLGASPNIFMISAMITVFSTVFSVGTSYNFREEKRNKESMADEVGVRLTSKKVALKFFEKSISGYYTDTKKNEKPQETKLTNTILKALISIPLIIPMLIMNDCLPPTDKERIEAINKLPEKNTSQTLDTQKEIKLTPARNF